MAHANGYYKAKRTDGTDPTKKLSGIQEQEDEEFTTQAETKPAASSSEEWTNPSDFKARLPQWMTTPWNERTRFDETALRAKEKTNADEATHFFAGPNTRDDPDHDQDRDDLLQETQTQIDGGLPGVNDNYKSRSPERVTPRSERTGFEDRPEQAKEKTKTAKTAKFFTQPNTRYDPDHDRDRDDYLQETQKQMDGGLSDVSESYNSRPPDWMTPREDPTGFKERDLQKQDQPNTRDDPDHDKERDAFLQETQSQMDGGLPDANDGNKSRSPDLIPQWRERFGFDGKSLRAEEKTNVAKKAESFTKPNIGENNSRSSDWMTPSSQQTSFEETAFLPQDKATTAKTAESSTKVNTRDDPDHDKERDDFLQATQTQMDGGLPARGTDWMTPRVEPTGFKETSLQSQETPNSGDYLERDDYLQETQSQMDGGLPDADDYYNSRPADWTTPRGESTGFKSRALQSPEEPNTRYYPEGDVYLQDTHAQMDGSLPDADDYYNSPPKDWMTPREEPSGFKELSLRSQEKPNTDGDYLNYDGERDDILQDNEKQQESAVPKKAADHANVTKKWCCRPSSLALLAMLASLLIIAIAVPLALSGRGGSASDASDNYPIGSPTADTSAPTTEPTVAETSNPSAVTAEPAVAATLAPSAGTLEPAAAATSSPTPVPVVAATTAPTQNPADAATTAPTPPPTAVATIEPSVVLTPEQIGCNFLSLNSLSHCRDTVGYNVRDAHGSGSTLPSEIGLLTQMAYLSFHGEQLTGSIPSSFSSLTRLALLDVSSNGLTGSIPASLCSQKALIYIDCGEIECNCCLAGDSPYQACPSPTQTTAPTPAPSSTTIQERIACNFLSLTNLDECRSTLEFTSYDGRYSTSGSTIPSEIGLLTQLRHLDLYNNELSGSIPSSIGRLTQLSSLNFSLNELTGSIPSSFSNLVQLVDLDFSFNKLTGSIPSLISKLTRLTDLAFTFNKLSGTIPSSLSTLALLGKLAFTANLLTGSIPMFLESLSQLVYFSVSNNSLTGSIPSSLCSHVTSPFIDCGEIECSCCADYFLDACT